MRGVTTTVRQNFELVFEAFYGPEAGLKIKDFTTAYQDSPQQDTNCDCGIFVMNFMSSWDGRRVAILIMNKSTTTGLKQQCTSFATKETPRFSLP